MKFAFIARHVGRFPTRWMCRRLSVSPSGFYAWRRRGPSPRAVADERLRTRIKAHNAASGGTYGSPRIRSDLQAEGTSISRRRVARLMREQGLQGRRKRRFRTTTVVHPSQPAAPNLLKRRFSVPAPDVGWVCDISYVRTWEGWLYVAVVIDLYARRVVGYAMADHMRTELVLEALDAAVVLRRPEAGLIVHSDRGSQYTSDAHRHALRRIGARASTSARGTCFDNAVAESFFGTLKEELIYRRAWPTISAAKSAIAAYIDGFYNSRRRHSTLGFVSPIDFEVATHQQRFAA